MRLQTMYILLYSLIACLLCLSPLEGVQVIRFQEDGVASSYSEAVYKGVLRRSTLVSSLTLCARFKIFFFHTRSTLFYLTDTVDSKIWMLSAEVWIDKVRVAISHAWNFQPLPQYLWTFRWYHLCFTYEDDRGRIRTFLNGEMVRQNYYRVSRPVKGDYARIGNGITKNESYSGDLSQINVWNRVLTNDEIKQIASCQTDPQGSYVSWEVGWTLSNVTSYDIPLDQFCQNDESNRYFWFPGVLQQGALYICEALGAHLPTVTSLEEAEHLYRALEERWPDSETCPLFYWSDLNDEEDEGVFVRGYDKYIDNSSYWAENEPNGYIYENCAVIRPHGVADEDCSLHRCALCTLTEAHRYIFRGTCENELRNVYFIAYQEEFGGLTFKSYGSYHIKKVNESWLFFNTVDNDVIATMEAVALNFPMGRRWWRLERDICDMKSGEMKKLLLTSCNDTQFTCDDATCIPHRYRCDLKYDCIDQSDEMECLLISFREGYQNHLAPRPPMKDNAYVPIVIGVFIKTIEIHSEVMDLRLSYDLEMSWFDNRLEYINLKENENLNVPITDSIKMLWSPLVRLVNSDTFDNKILDGDAVATIRMLQGPTRRDDSVPAKVYVYSGEENPIIVKRMYVTTYTCEFDLTLYPFDRQDCYMHLQVTSGQASMLEIHRNSTVMFLGSKLYNEYQIGDVTMLLDAPRHPSEVRIRIPLIRLYGFSILNIYIPSLILLFISYFTLFFRRNFFDLRIMTVLTALLVLATLFSQASSNLPQTSYFKMVDIWLLFCVLVTFLVIIFHMLIEHRSYEVTVIKTYPESSLDIPIFERYFFWVPNVSVEKLEFIARFSIFTLFDVFIVTYVAVILI